MHCQNSKFRLNKQFGITWNPLAASTASWVVKGFWMNFPLHLVHLDINWSSEILSWNVSITCRSQEDHVKTTKPLHWTYIRVTSSSWSFFRRLFSLYIWFFIKYSCLRILASRVKSTLFSFCAWSIRSLVKINGRFSQVHVSSDFYVTKDKIVFSMAFSRKCIIKY